VRNAAREVDTAWEGDAPRHTDTAWAGDAARAGVTTCRERERGRRERTTEFMLGAYNASPSSHSQAAMFNDVTQFIQ